jgi:hypothetical protein
MIHQLVTVAAVAGVHLGPVVLRRAGQTAQVTAHRGDRAVGGCGGAAGHNRRPLVRPVGVLLHVFSQIGLLGVALAAVRTDVCLEMLGLLVLGNVVQKRGFVVETLVAGVALVGLVCLVAPGVGLQVGQL